MSRVEINLIASITVKDVARLLTIVYDTFDGKNTRVVVSVGDKPVGDYSANKIQNAFCDRMSKIGLMNKVVSGFVITELGLQAIKVLNKTFHE